mgnify:FL=1
MVINYNGHNYFKIQAGETTILVDPLDQRSFRGASLIINTLTPAMVAIPKDGPVLIEHQGEYDAAGISVLGWSVQEKDAGEKEKTIYRIKFDDLILILLGHITQEPSATLLEHIKEADILFIPAGGKPFINQANAAKLVRELEPGIVIPTLFSNPRLFLEDAL